MQFAKTAYCCLGCLIRIRKFKAKKSKSTIQTEDKTKKENNYIPTAQTMKTLTVDQTWHTFTPNFSFKIIIAVAIIFVIR